MSAVKKVRPRKNTASYGWKKSGVLIGTVAFVLLLWSTPFVRSIVGNSMRDVLFIVSPTAERAYAYGTSAFDATSPEQYNLERAAYYFDRAFTIDPTLPYVQHQRARIAFLASDFDEALRLVDAEIALPNGPKSPTSHYLRGLILGYMDRFDEAGHSYETYLRTDPKNWAALNDYAWVMLKAGKPGEALIAVDWGLLSWPQNPWLLNTKSIAHYELGDTEKAFMAVTAANELLGTLTAPEWSKAYPGNDPLIAARGVEEFQKSVNANMHIIFLSRTASTEAVR